jgi:hypothetical protein
MSDLRKKGNSSAPRKKPAATASSATTTAASTKKQFGKFRLPTNCRDMTLASLERSSELLAVPSSQSADQRCHKITGYALQL